MRNTKARVLFGVLLLLITSEFTSSAQEPNRVSSTGNGSTSKPTFEETFPTPFLQAIANGHVWIVDAMLHKGLAPNVKDGTEQRLSPLFVAILNKRNRVLEVLLDYNPNLEVKDQFGITPLMAACYIKDFEAVRLLLDAGAKINGIEKVTPVMIAAKYTDLEILNELIRRGADLHLRTDKGATALMIAGDDSKIIDVLIKGGSRVDSVDANGWAALHHAIDSKQLIKIEALVKAGADDLLPDKSGITARRLAEQERDLSVRRSILDILRKAKSISR
jgi:ankyrin repeat protein